PVAFWAFRNNMQENTMGIFTLAAVWFILRGLITGRQLYLNLAAGGVMIFLASFSKGVPGLFPLAVPFWWWVTRRGVPFARVVVWTSVLLLIPAAIYALLMLHEPARLSLTHYAQARLLGRIHDAHTVEYRFHIVLRLLQELLVPLALTLVMLVMFRLRRIPNRIDSAWRSNMILLLLTGLSGSLPLMLTLVQKAFYFAHALPFFGLGLAMAIALGTTCLISGIRTGRRPFKTFTVITAVILAGVIVFSMMQHGKYIRNKELLEDVYRLGEVIAPRSLISIDPEMWNQWDLQCYLVRHFNISADPGDTMHPWYLRNKSTMENTPEGYLKTDVNLNLYSLFIQTGK
ncbi:MAG: hypothetical protein JW861_05800, partial [Bacteroidales bacterium]|nr:hypothetical protein [Bacteroidales bacterium]